VAFFVALCATFLGRATLRAIAFPLAFLVLMAPFPTAVTNGIEAWLQHRSADASHLLFQLVGTPIFRHETYFELPGIKLYVAPECSGIHSSLALFIVSLVAGQLFLTSPWRRAILALCVIPLAIVRNAFRILVIGELCVRYGPHMFDSYIHRQGGPIFFALSLIPFLAILWWLIRGESRRTARS
jgi:exosortase C (VPDSG-CTERM-specific)